MTLDELEAKWRTRADAVFNIVNPAEADAWLTCADDLKAANLALGEPSADLRAVEAIVRNHRRHVELSPGVGASAQAYGLAVCDDILTDLTAALSQRREQP